MSIKARRIHLRIAWYSNYGSEKGSRTVSGYVLDRIWAVHREDGDRLWTLTHRPSGFSAGQHYGSFTMARRCAAALNRSVPAKAWRFTDPETVRDNPVFKDTKRIVETFESKVRS